MVGKMVIIFNNYTLVGKIAVIIISFAKDTLVGGKAEIIFTSFNKNSLMEIIIVRFDTVSIISFDKDALVGKMEINTISFGNISSVDKMKIIFISSYKDTLIGSKFWSVEWK